MIKLHLACVYVSGLPLVDTVEHLQLILRTLCVYRSVAPASMRDHVLDFAGLLEGTRGACLGSGQPERLAELQLNLLELLSGSGAHQIAWMKEVSGIIYWYLQYNLDWFKLFLNIITVL